MKRIGVLLVDDERLVTDALARLIDRERDLHVLGSARDPVEAAEVAGRWAPDVALVDVNMPGGGGAAAISRIIHASPRTKIVVLSGVADRNTVLEMIGAGAAGYSVKEDGPSKVLDAIRDVSNGRAAISNRVAATLTEEVGRSLRKRASERDAATRTRGRIQDILRVGGPEILFQPIVDLVSGSTVGVEALARFDGGSISPDQWFRQAALVGLETELEIAAIDRAFSEARALPRGWFVSVNVSPNTLVHHDLTKHATAARRPVVFEITEHSPVEDYAALDTSLKGLRSAGAAVAVDDVGAGYANFRHILELDPEFVKVDISLSRHINERPREQALTGAIVAFSRHCRAHVVAEGVEDVTEAEVLRAMGVTYGQGYLWSRPTPAADLVAMSAAAS